jgi:transglutaminase-like putative cysteine protease
MTVRYRIRHETAYTYDADVVHSHHLLHLVPRPAPYQQCVEHEIEISPMPNRRVSDIDAFGNPMLRVELVQAHRELRVVSQMQVEVHTRPAVLADTTEPWEKVREAFRYRGAWPSRDELDAARFRHESPHVKLKKAFTDYSAECFPEGAPILACAERLSTKLHADIEYVPGVTTIGTPATELLETRRGVCQDFAHLMIGALRASGLPARYVSGYLLTDPPPGRPRLIGADASHAWVSVWCGGAAGEADCWIDVDPTNDCLVDDEHVTLGWGRDFGDVTPMRGVILGGGEQELTVRVTVTPQ